MNALLDEISSPILQLMDILIQTEDKYLITPFVNYVTNYAKVARMGKIDKNDKEAFKSNIFGLSQQKIPKKLKEKLQTVLLSVEKYKIGSGEVDPDLLSKIMYIYSNISSDLADDYARVIYKLSDHAIDITRILSKSATDNNPPETLGEAVVFDLSESDDDVEYVGGTRYSMVSANDAVAESHISGQGEKSVKEILDETASQPLEEIIKQVPDHIRDICEYIIDYAQKYYMTVLFSYEITADDASTYITIIFGDVNYSGNLSNVTDIIITFHLLLTIIDYIDRIIVLQYGKSQSTDAVVSLEDIDIRKKVKDQILRAINDMAEHVQTWVKYSEEGEKEYYSQLEKLRTEEAKQLSVIMDKYNTLISPEVPETCIRRYITLARLINQGKLPELQGVDQAMAKYLYVS